MRIISEEAFLILVKITEQKRYNTPEARTLVAELQVKYNELTA